MSSPAVMDGQTLIAALRRRAAHDDCLARDAADWMVQAIEGRAMSERDRFWRALVNIACDEATSKAISNVARRALGWHEHEEAVRACPICGLVLANSCHHDGEDIASRKMSVGEARKLREEMYAELIERAALYAEPEETEAARCDVVRPGDGARCDLRAGHDGLHGAGAYSWRQEARF